MSNGSRVQRRTLSDILIDEGTVPRGDVEAALSIQETTGETLGAILFDMGKISSQEVAKSVCVHFQLPFIGLRNYDYDPKLMEKFTPDFLHQHKILPFDSIGDMMLCAVIEIPSEKTLADIPRITRSKVAFFVGNLEEIDQALKDHRPLAEDSELLKRRRHVHPQQAAAAAEGGADDENTVFTEQSSEELMEALDNTWESIFNEIEATPEGEGEGDGTTSSE